MAIPPPIDVTKWRLADRGVRIDKFVATALAMGGQFHPDDPTRPLIHWRGGGAYQVANGAVWSTSFDTRKLDENDPTVEIQFISKRFAVSENAVYFWEKPFIKDYTTLDVYDLVIDKGLNKYRYNGNGSGCRTWTTALIAALESEDVLPAGSEMSFLEVVGQARANPAIWVPDESGAKFYKT